MSRLILASLVAGCVALAACDSAPGIAPLDAPGEEAYTLMTAIGDASTPLRADGRAEYVLSDLPREAGYRTATLTMLPERAGLPGVRVALYVSQDGRDIFPASGTYEAGSVGATAPLVTATIGGRTFSPYRGTVTVESASETEFVGQLDLEMTTGGCALLPTCSGPTETGTLRARFRATAMEGQHSGATVPSRNP